MGQHKIEGVVSLAGNSIRFCGLVLHDGFGIGANIIKGSVIASVAKQSHHNEPLGLRSGAIASLRSQ
jgi:hypothetical protein